MPRDEWLDFLFGFLVALMGVVVMALLALAGVPASAPPEERYRLLSQAKWVMISAGGLLTVVLVAMFLKNAWGAVRKLFE